MSKYRETRIYTTHAGAIGKMLEIANKNTIFIRVTRHDVKIDPRLKFFILKSLAPSKELLNYYKRTDDWNGFKERFMDDVRSNSNFNDAVNLIGKSLKMGMNIVFICCEKDGKHCHRQILARFFSALFKYNWEEL